MNAACIFSGPARRFRLRIRIPAHGYERASLDPDLETVFLMAADKWQFVSASFVKEICSLWAAMSTEFVTPQVAEKLQEKVQEIRRVMLDGAGFKSIMCVSPLEILRIDRLAQLVEHMTFNHGVVGSNPTAVTIHFAGRNL
jgi:hypothetical protein